jgi:hypothetical protein
MVPDGKALGLGPRLREFDSPHPDSHQGGSWQWLGWAAVRQMLWLGAAWLG